MTVSDICLQNGKAWIHLVTLLENEISMNWIDQGSVPLPREPRIREPLTRSIGLGLELFIRKTSMSLTELVSGLSTRGISTNLTEHDLEPSTRGILMKLTRLASELSIDILNKCN